MHVHVSALDAVIVFLYVILIGALWRVVASHLSQYDGPAGEVGKAMGFLY
jgi:hypothetical protein